jgi:hypothetical protein
MGCSCSGTGESVINHFKSCPSSSHVLLLELKVLIFLVKMYQFVLYKSFNFLLIVLMLVISSLDFQWWLLVVLWLCL